MLSFKIQVATGEGEADLIWNFEPNNPHSLRPKKRAHLLKNFSVLHILRKESMKPAEFLLKLITRGS